MGRIQTIHRFYTLAVFNLEFPEICELVWLNRIFLEAFRCFFPIRVVKWLVETTSFRPSNSILPVVGGLVVDLVARISGIFFSRFASHLWNPKVVCDIHPSFCWGICVGHFGWADMSSKICLAHDFLQSKVDHGIVFSKFRCFFV